MNQIDGAAALVNDNFLFLPDTDSLEDAHELLRPLKTDLFVVQLDGWLRDPNAWPQDRSSAVFDQWFAYNR